MYINNKLFKIIKFNVDFNVDLFYLIFLQKLFKIKDKKI